MSSCDNHGAALAGFAAVDEDGGGAKRGGLFPPGGGGNIGTGPGDFEPVDPENAGIVVGNDALNRVDGGFA